MARKITFNEVCHNGACVDGVLEFYKKHFNGHTTVDMDEVVRVGGSEVKKYLALDGYGDGDGDGYGDGYGYGYGYGDGYGDGDGNGYGYGYGDGYGDGYGGI